MAKALTVEAVASAATTSVARITGLRASLRGSSLTKDSPIARLMTLALSAVPVTADLRLSPRWTVATDMGI